MTRSRLFCLATAISLLFATQGHAQQPNSVPVTPEQATTEIALTSLLNQLFQLGIVSELHGIRREGDVYIADVTTIDFQRATLEINAITGQIVQR